MENYYLKCKKTKIYQNMKDISKTMLKQKFIAGKKFSKQKGLKSVFKDSILKTRKMREND